MPRDWNRLERWFEESHEQFQPDVMKMKMTKANVRFARILPHTSLHDLLQEYFAYCTAAKATESSDVDRNTQRDFTLRLVMREGCTVDVCLHLYNGRRSAAAPPLYDDGNLHEIDKQAVLLEALSIVLTEDWRATSEASQSPTSSSY
jgi:hypothetical protein